VNRRTIRGDQFTGEKGAIPANSIGAALRDGKGKVPASSQVRHHACGIAAKQPN
jgi:hypothetical protein